MNEPVRRNRKTQRQQPFGLTSRVRRSLSHFLPRKISRQFDDIGSKLTLLVISLVALLTFGTAFLVISIMNDVLMHSMIKRGAATVYAIASSAGYSILSDDRLALDNLAAQTKRSQEDLTYVAILDRSQTILAHSQLELEGKRWPRLEGELIERDGLLRITRVFRNGLTVYEFSLPINFSAHRVGEVVIGLNPQSLVAARSAAHWRILFIASLAMLCGTLGTVFLSRLFTRPITQLYQGVERLKSGAGKVNVPVLSNDELGGLTRSFNAMAAEIVHQRQGLLDSSADLEKSYHDIVRILAGALDARDNYTYGHSARVARLAVMLGKQLELDTSQLKELEMSCLLHDIGKIRVPDNILNKREPLNHLENSRIQKHPHHGVEILELANSLHCHIPTVKHHHEWYNGQGYPDGLCDEQIPLNAQIVAIADAYDAMTTSRPYRQGLPHEAAVAEIQRFRGTQFAPYLTDIFVATLQQQGHSELEVSSQ
ncbi:HD domain-containing phosphohydrolase [Geopsychrobacter electrodiphilus]|uniref:HD domain-containing phosphohydrolase n=1 Tax=Geopsychrobacter electrodiphilus TaxID=225196 RepID=UPI00036ABF2A|nr:HD domain-containing phosphohydrolase [Geopsychrobacter electrodiphilus]